MARALKPGAPLAFTYHHNTIEAYFPVAVAILDSGLTCSASLPCPAEMGSSIHIEGTNSSIVDTVFVCRKTGTSRREWLANTPGDLARIVSEDLGRLRRGNVKPTRGDTRCIIYGHLIRLAIWSLRLGWNMDEPTNRRMLRVADWVRDFGGLTDVEACMQPGGSVQDLPLFAANEEGVEYGVLSEATCPGSPSEGNAARRDESADEW